MFYTQEKSLIWTLEISFCTTYNTAYFLAFCFVWFLLWVFFFLFSSLHKQSTCVWIMHWCTTLFTKSQQGDDVFHETLLCQFLSVTKSYSVCSLARSLPGGKEQHTPRADKTGAAFPLPGFSHLEGTCLHLRSLRVTGGRCLQHSGSCWFHPQNHDGGEQFRLR